MGKKDFEMTDLYLHKDRMYVAADCIILGFDAGSLKLLVFKRRIKPRAGEWSLIGSFVKLEEDVSTAAERVLEEITGLKNVFLEELKTYGAANRDPGFRCISVAHYALIRIDSKMEKTLEEHGAVWFSLDELPDLVLDHNTMVNDALERIRQKARFQPLGFELLPKKFSIPQLQRLYEAIYRKDLDTRNFRKKVLSLGVLKKLEEKDKINSRRGAFLYQFEDKMYRKLLKSGFNFEL